MSPFTPHVRTPSLPPAADARHPWLPVVAPAPCGVPPFPPLRVRGGGAHRLRRALRRQRRAMAAGLALTAAALAASGLSASGLGTDGPGASGPGGAGDAAAGPGAAVHRSGRLVSAPVRIADAETVRLLRPGDRVDVIAADDASSDARVVAKGVRVASVPRPAGEAPTGGPEPADGALVVLSVERGTATALAGAGASGRLAVAVAHAH
ncbi:RcpC/CpaB family pilus assembly protein [Streptomyces sp. NPDC048560]|uniref:RcpC/CpaB family pilus assembly protein n=1 Tax=Streptomyces sp. NPDC048560 TaxID=3155488 RepID=UPI00342FA4DA